MGEGRAFSGSGSVVAALTGLRNARAIYFDVDDTLYDFAASMDHAFAHLRRAFPQHFGNHDVDKIRDAYWSHYNAYGEDRKAELINSDPDLFRRTMWAGALRSLGLDPSLDGFAREVTNEMQ